MKSRFLITACLTGSALLSFAQVANDGVEYYKADQFGNAKELLLRNLDNPQLDKAESQYYLGLIALQEGNTAEASRYFDAGVMSDAAYPYCYVGQGSLLLRNGDLKGAEKLFKEAEGKSKKDASLEIAIARAYYEADPVAYDKQIQKAIEKARKYNMYEADIYIFEGDRLYDKKDWGGAAAQYEMGANFESSATEAYVKYANLYTQVNPKYAITMLKKLLELNPQSALGQRELANAYYNDQDYNNAAVEYGKYVNNPARFKQDEDRYAFLLFYGGDFKKGFDYSSKLLKENPSNFTAQRYQFMNAAQLPELKDQLLPMAEALYAAHKSNSANKFAAIDFTLIADEFKIADRIDESIAVLKEAMVEMPDNANFNKQLAMTYVEANRITDAADVYQGYLAKIESPNFNDFIQQATFSFYAGVEDKTKDADKSKKYFDDAIKFARKAAESMPEHYKPVKMEGDIAAQQAPDEAAAKAAAAPFYEKAIVLLEASENPARYASDAKNMYNYMGNYYLDQKNVAKAKEYFNKYLEFDPNNEAYRKFVEGLK